MASGRGCFRCLSHCSLYTMTTMATMTMFDCDGSSTVLMVFCFSDSLSNVYLFGDCYLNTTMSVTFVTVLD